MPVARSSTPGSVCKHFHSSDSNSNHGSSSNCSKSGTAVSFLLVAVLLACSCQVIAATPYTPTRSAVQQDGQQVQPAAAVHPAVQQAVQQYRYQCSSGDYAGTDVDWAYGQSKETCEDMCNKSEECTFYVFGVDNVCFLKNSLSEGPDGSNNPDAAYTSCAKLLPSEYHS